ncbi:MAG: 5-methyltetrahydropteroyltriglutamate--homocysteine S-methyltransferase [Brevinematia bacterium]
MVKSYAYGFPRIGKNREFKRAVEEFWSGKISDTELSQNLDKIQKEIIDVYSSLDHHPVGEITGYDNILDTAIMLNVYPKPQSWKEYYNLVRGKDALEITKWFNTNYHYVVPVISETTNFVLSWNKPLEEFIKNKSSKSLPFVIGPFTFLKLSKGNKNYRDSLENLKKAYSQIFDSLVDTGAKLIHVDEPGLVFELEEDEREFVRSIYSSLSNSDKLIVFTYYDDIEKETLRAILSTPIAGIGIDFVHNGYKNLENVEAVKELFSNKILVAEVIDCRNVWKENILEVSEKVKSIISNIKAREIWISNAGPLYHLPYTTEVEEKLHPSIKERLAFAKEKIEEIKYLKSYLNGDETVVEWNNYKHDNSWWFSEKVRERTKGLKEEDFTREKPYNERVKLQSQWLNLPKFPTTTIGSFPQTEEIRQIRMKFKKGELSKEDYENFIKQKIRDLITLQEEIGLDVLVHGEFERSDMVEFFAEKLEGIATTEHGWILSYGTRVYRPPIIYGDVYRTKNLVIDEIVYAQSLTKKPVKAILTGPITILAWSYSRTDLSDEEIAYQISLAILDEIKELERNNIRIIQIDEPAFKEKAPIKRRDWDRYFNWAIRAFRLSSNASPEVQIHTHMCYSEFSDIIDKIYELDADVISIEASRSKGDVISAFERFKYDHQIGLGVYDVHSPEVPEVEKMKKVVERSLKFINPDNFWINPDCGLKTRKWEEVIPSLKNMVKLALSLRESLK